MQQSLKLGGSLDFSEGITPGHGHTEEWNAIKPFKTSRLNNRRPAFRGHQSTWLGHPPSPLPKKYNATHQHRWDNESSLRGAC